MRKNSSNKRSNYLNYDMIPPRLTLKYRSTSSFFPDQFHPIRAFINSLRAGSSGRCNVQSDKRRTKTSQGEGGAAFEVS